MPTRPSESTPWFTAEVQPHEPMLRAYLRGNFPAVRDVDDVVQESFLRLWRTRTTEPIRSAKAFLFLAARRVALNILRKQHNAPFVAYGESAASRVLDDKPDACEAAIVQERIDLLADALMSLPPRCRQAVVMHKIHGLTQREVASQLGISERTVETHVRSGVARCHAHLRARGLSAGPHAS
jgi:RNA polymerase sigma-70 factor (ECF subfamily)